MVRQCLAEFVMPDELIHKANEDYLSHVDTDWAPTGRMRCQLSDESPHLHSAFVRTVVGDAREVFVFWRGDNRTGILSLLDYCGELSADGTVCTVYRNHPGTCDPGHEEFEALAASGFALLVNEGIIEKNSTLWRLGMVLVKGAQSEST